MLSSRFLAAALPFLLACCAALAQEPPAEAPLSPARLYGPFISELETELARGAVSPAARPGLLTRLAALERRMAFAEPGSEREALASRVEEIGRRLGWRDAGRIGSTALAAGSIGGTVTAEETGSPIAEAQVLLYNEQGAPRAVAHTDAAGNYSFGGLEPGAYRLTAGTSAYASIAYPDAFCGPLCDPLLGSALAVPDGGSVDADFALVRRGNLRGSVTDGRNGAKVAFTFAMVYDPLWNQVAVVPVENGDFATPGLEPGSYYLHVERTGDLAPELFPDLPCLRVFTFQFLCDRDAAQSIAIPAETEVRVEVQLDPGGSIGGRIVDGESGQPLAGATFHLRDNDRGELGIDVQSAADGSYLVEGLPPGSYRGSIDQPGYAGELFRALPCIQYCGFPLTGLAAPLDLTGAQHLTGVDFAPRRLGSLAGMVRDRRTGLPIDGANIRIFRGDLPPLVETRSTSSESAGGYVFQALPAIDYYLFATAGGYAPLDGIDPGTWHTDPTHGRRVRVPAGGQANFDILLDPLSRLEVRVLGLPPATAYCTVEVWQPVASGAPRQVASDACGHDGLASIELPGAGPYFVSARGDFASTFLGVGPCFFDHENNFCDLTQATPVLLPPGETKSVELPVIPGSRLDIKVHRAGTGESVLARLVIQDAAGRTLRSLRSDFHNPFEIWPPGRYYLAALGAPAFQNVAYPQVPCTRFVCDPRQGRPLDLVSGADAAIVFELQPLEDPGTCLESAETLCVQQDRFRIEVEWEDFQAAEGRGRLLPLGSESGYSYFFSPGNVELMVKVLNGCSPQLGQHFWVFAAGLTNVEVNMRVTDTWTGAEKLYENPLGRTYPPILDIAAFATCNAPEPPRRAAPMIKAAKAEPIGTDEAAAGVQYCSPFTYNCIGGRFEVDVVFTSPDGSSSLASPTYLTRDTKAYTFFSESNFELLVKVLEACDRNGRFWFFAAGLTDIPVEIKVLDLATQQSQVFKSLGGPFQPIFDLQTLSCATSAPTASAP